MMPTRNLKDDYKKRGMRLREDLSRKRDNVMKIREAFTKNANIILHRDIFGEEQ
jgi:hypothetical protein